MCESNDIGDALKYKLLTRIKKISLGLLSALYTNFFYKIIIKKALKKEKALWIPFWSTEI